MKIIPASDEGLSPRLGFIRDAHAAWMGYRLLGLHQKAEIMKMTIHFAIRCERAERAIVVRRLIRDIMDPKET